jgi:hypothetical protein
MNSAHDDLLQEELAYYRARAGEYDEWFLRQGRYDRLVDRRGTAGGRPYNPADRPCVLWVNL